VILTKFAVPVFHVVLLHSVSLYRPLFAPGIAIRSKHEILHKENVNIVTHPCNLRPF